jgi:hypothetical protein
MGNILNYRLNNESNTDELYKNIAESTKILRKEFSKYSIIMSQMKEMDKEYKILLHGLNDNDEDEFMEKIKMLDYVLDQIKSQVDLDRCQNLIDNVTDLKINITIFLEAIAMENLQHKVDFYENKRVEKLEKLNKLIEKYSKLKASSYDQEKKLSQKFSKLKSSSYDQEKKLSQKFSKLKSSSYDQEKKLSQKFSKLKSSSYEHNNSTKSNSKDEAFSRSDENKDDMIFFESEKEDENKKISKKVKKKKKNKKPISRNKKKTTRKNKKKK